MIERTIEHLNSAPRDPKSMQRAHRRLTYREPAAEVALQNPQSSSSARFVAPVRNVSNRGMAILHAAFTHKGTRCVVRLVDVDQKAHMIAGEIVRCRYVDNWMHELSIRFDDSIDASRFAMNEEIRMRALVIDSDAAAAGHTAAALHALGVDVDIVAAPAEALERAKAQFYDALVVEPASPGVELATFAATWRSAGFARPIVAVTKLTADPGESGAATPGFSAWMSKPLSEAKASELQAMIRTGDAVRKAA